MVVPFHPAMATVFSSCLLGGLFNVPFYSKTRFSAGPLPFITCATSE